MIFFGLTGSFIVYFVLYIVPISPTVWVLNRQVYTHKFNTTSQV